MKQIKKRWLGLVIAPALLALIGFASPANATSYTSCASVPATVFGDADITDTACVFANDVSATGRITVTATSIIATNLTASFDIELQAVDNLKTGLVTASRNISLISSSGNIDTKDLTADQGTLKVKADGKITIVGITKTSKYDIDLDAKNIVKTNAITSGSHIRVNSTDENINITSTVDSNIDDTSGGNILLTANKSIFTRAINTHSNTKPGSVRIVANKGGANTLFIVGTTATTNGVKGTITTNTVTGGGTNPTTFNFGISIQNGGTAMSAGGIKVDAMGNLKIAASGSKAGTIILDAKNGILTLPTGTLNANAASGKQAGRIVLLAKTVTTASGTILSATQTSAAPGSGHSISIAAETLNLAGPTGLKIQTNGNGVAGFPALASLSPQGSVTVNSNDSSVFFVYWQLSNFASTTTAKPLTVAGAAPLTMISDGDESQVLASGFPLTFSNSDITLQSRGKLNHRVDVVYQGADNGLTNFDFSNTGTVTLDANGVGGAGGKTSVYGGRILLNAPVFNITANGPATGNGNGGEVYFRGIATTLNPASKVSFKANAALVGTGNAVLGDIATPSAPKAIIFYPGYVSFDIGTNVGQYSFSANGGMTAGNAGTIEISSLPVRIMTTDAIRASALSASGNGNGGEIFFYSTIESVDPAATVSAIGKGTGTGGKFTAFYYEVPNSFDERTPSTMFKVNGGDGLNVTGFDGSITLANVPCRQWKIGTGTGNTTWPKTYWKCANPDTVTSDVYTAPAEFANSLNAMLKSQLNANNNELYVFSNVTDFNAYFNFSASSTTPSATRFYPLAGVPENALTALFKASPTVEQLKELTAHELAHNLDRNAADQSVNGDYTIALHRDFATLDYVVMGNSPDDPANVPRDACVGATAPFKNAIDENTQTAICTAGVLDSRFIVNGNPMRNSKISSIASPRLDAKAPEEFYAQSFAISVYAKNLTVSQMVSTTADVVTGKNGYFACTTAWAANRATGALSDPTGLPASCTTLVPVWYQDLLLGNN
jgi:hypothetical protein